MSDISQKSAETRQYEKAALDYLLANSELARSLEEVTLQELLVHQTDQKCCIWLLSKLPQLEKDRLKLSNCLLDNVAPYDSLIGLSNKRLKKLKHLCKYFMLSDNLCEKIDKVIENGVDIKKYDFDIQNIYKWAEIGDVRGLEWARQKGYPWPKKMGKYVFSCSTQWSFGMS